MASIRTDWQRKEVQGIFELPLNELLFQAQTVHRQHFSPNSVQLSSLLSIKTGACPEDCGYCSQSGHHNTGLEKEKLMSLEEVKVAAQAAKDNGATRFCMGAAWRSMPKSAEDHIVDMVTVVKDLGLESCMTLGMLESDQAAKLSKAGLDYYNHNLDTSPERYGEIVTTRTYEDRLNTLKNVREQGMKVCCGGILGLGETRDDRISLLMQLSNMEQQPESVPINQLIPVPGTPLENAERVDGIEFVRTCAVARILMPKSYVRLSAGRHEMTHELQALCFQAGVNSIFYGEKLLTEGNQVPDEDGDLFQKLGLQVETLTA